MIRRLALVSALAVAPLLSAAPAQAIPHCKAGYQCDRAYYTDRTHQDQVGGITHFCDGSTIQWGETTIFVVTTQVPCPND